MLLEIDGKHWIKIKRFIVTEEFMILSYNFYLHL